MPKTTHAPLTDPQVKALTADGTPTDVRDGGARGLILTVFPTGRKVFSMRYVFGGKHRRLVLGEYPKLTLAKARDAGRACAPAGAGRRRSGGATSRRQRWRPADTVEPRWRSDYLDEHAATKRSAAEDRRILERDVLPYWKRSIGLESDAGAT
jgi:hypothetical protein